MRITGKGAFGPPADHQKALQVLREVLQLGINFIDTADSYGPHHSEQLIAEALRPYPKDLVIATKGGFERPSASEWTMNGDPTYLENALKGSLQRLGQERIDLYQLHRIDPKVPAEETLGKLKDLQQAGLIRHIGLSEVSVEQLEMASKIIDVVAVQNRYSLTNRKWEGVLRWCEQNDAAFIPWYPLDAGALENPTLQQLALKYDLTVYQLALAWLLAHSPNMLPIPGTSSVAHLRENVAAAAVALSPVDKEALDNIAAS